jgi:hypothetical protein
VILRPYSRSCRTASIRSGIAGGLAGELGRWTADLDEPLAGNAAKVNRCYHSNGLAITRATNAGLDLTPLRHRHSARRVRPTSLMASRLAIGLAKSAPRATTRFSS